MGALTLAFSRAGAENVYVEITVPTMTMAATQEEVRGRARRGPDSRWGPSSTAAWAGLLQRRKRPEGGRGGAWAAGGGARGGARG